MTYRRDEYRPFFDAEIRKIGLKTGMEYAIIEKKRETERLL